VSAERSSSYGGGRGRRSSRAWCTEKKRARRTVAGEEALGGAAEKKCSRRCTEKKALGARLLGSVAAAVGAILGCGGGSGAPGRV